MEAGSHFDKFSLLIPMAEYQELDDIKNRYEKLVDYKNDMINENRLHAE